MQRRKKSWEKIRIYDIRLGFYDYCIWIWIFLFRSSFRAQPKMEIGAALLMHHRIGTIEMWVIAFAASDSKRIGSYVSSMICLYVQDSVVNRNGSGGSVVEKLAACIISMNFIPFRTGIRCPGLDLRPTCGRRTFNLCRMKWNKQIRIQTKYQLNALGQSWNIAAHRVHTAYREPALAQFIIQLLRGRKIKSKSELLIHIIKINVVNLSFTRLNIDLLWAQWAVSNCIMWKSASRPHAEKIEVSTRIK